VIRVVVADDQALFRAGFRVLLEPEDDVELVGEAGDGVTALEVVRRTRPDVVLMDVRVPGMDGSRRPGRSPPTSGWPASGW
jgi:DNA-binding NarL/FixJ family response regulator